MLDRLEKFIKYQNLTINGFETKISASNGQIRRAIRNKTTLQTDVIEKIASVFGELSLDWLFRGDGEMIRKTGQFLDFDDTKDQKPTRSDASSGGEMVIAAQRDTIEAQKIAIGALTRENKLLYEKIGDSQKEDAPAVDNAECAVAV